MDWHENLGNLFISIYNSNFSNEYKIMQIEVELGIIQREEIERENCD